MLKKGSHYINVEFCIVVQGQEGWFKINIIDTKTIIAAVTAALLLKEMEIKGIKDNEQLNELVKSEFDRVLDILES